MKEIDYSKYWNGAHSSDPQSYGYRGEIKNCPFSKCAKVEGGEILVDRDGKPLTNTVYDYIDVSGYQGRGWKVRLNGKWGLVNARIESVIPVDFEEIKTLYGKGFFLKKNGKWGYLPITGSLGIDFVYDELSEGHSGIKGFAARLNGKWGLVDYEGNVLIPCEYDDIYVNHKGMARLKKDGKYGFLKVGEDSRIPFVYDYAKSFALPHPDECEVMVQDRWGVIDSDGNIIVPIVYDSVSVNTPNLYRVEKDGKTGIIDGKGEILFPFIYNKLGKFSKNNIAKAANEDGLYGYVDRENNLVADFMYEKADDFEDRGRYAKVSKGIGKVGMIDMSGNEAVPLEYHDVRYLYEGIAEVTKRNGIYGKQFVGLYDIDNGLALPCEYERIEDIGRNREGVVEYVCWIDKRREPERGVLDLHYLKRLYFNRVVIDAVQDMIDKWQPRPFLPHEVLMLIGKNYPFRIERIRGLILPGLVPKKNIDYGRLSSKIHSDNFEEAVMNLFEEIYNEYFRMMMGG